MFPTTTTRLLKHLPRELLLVEIMSWLTLDNLACLELVSRDMATCVQQYLATCQGPRDLPRLLAMHEYERDPSFRVMCTIERHMKERQVNVAPHLVYDHGGENGQVRVLAWAHRDGKDDWVGTEVWPRRFVPTMLVLPRIKETKPMSCVPRVRWYACTLYSCHVDIRVL